MKKLLYVSLAGATGLVLAAQTASAQLSITAGGEAGRQTITFDANVGTISGTGTSRDGQQTVYHAGSAATALGMAEIDNFAAGGGSSPTLVTTAWAYRGQYTNFTGLSANTRSSIAFDANNNGTTNDRSSVLDGHVNYINTLKTTSDGVISIERNSFSTFDFTLKATNNTGAAVSQWSFLLDTYYDMSGANDSLTNIQLSYSGTETGTYTTLASRSVQSTTAAGGTAGFSSADAGTLQNLGGNFNLTVPNGGSLFLRFSYDPTTGDGTGVAFDNFSVAAVAVPEPSTYALLLGSVGMLTLFRRRR